MICKFQYHIAKQCKEHLVYRSVHSHLEDQVMEFHTAYTIITILFKWFQQVPPLCCYLLCFIDICWIVKQFGAISIHQSIDSIVCGKLNYLMRKLKRRQWRYQGTPLSQQHRIPRGDTLHSGHSEPYHFTYMAALGDSWFPTVWTSLVLVSTWPHIHHVNTIRSV